MLSRSSRLVVATVLAVLAFGAAPANADHVSIDASVSAQQGEVRESSVLVIVTWNVACHGADDPSFSGHLHLDDPMGGGRMYLGGVSSGSGSTRSSVSRGEEDRSVSSFLSISCWDGDDLHGAGPAERAGQPVLIPGLDRGSGDGDGPGGGADGPGGGDDGDGDGAGPPPSGGLACAAVVRGTPGADRLSGTPGSDRLLGLAGNDRLRGRGGDDCLFGGLGRDRLYGGPGDDELHAGAHRNVLVAGRGDDLVVAANGRRDAIRCGRGRDTARIDGADRTTGCERVTRVA